MNRRARKILAVFLTVTVPLWIVPAIVVGVVMFAFNFILSVYDHIFEILGKEV